MFSIVWLIKAWQTTDCYAALLLTANSYTRLLCALSPQLSISTSLTLILHLSPASVNLSILFSLGHCDLLYTYHYY